MSENETPTHGSKRRKVARPPPPSAVGKKTLPMADGKKQLSSPRLESTTQEYLPALANKHLLNLHKNSDLWDADTVKARKAAVEVSKAFTSHVDLSHFKELGVAESPEMVAFNLIRVSLNFLATKRSQLMSLSVMEHPISSCFAALACVQCFQCFQEKRLQDAALVAEAHAKILKLTQELEEAQSEVKLAKINQEMAKILVEQARHEKYIVELKSTGEKARLKRKIEQLETEFQQQRDRFNDAISEAEVDGYNKCVKKAKEKGLRYKKLLLDPSCDPIDNQQENSPVPSSAEKLNNLDNVPDSANGVPVGTDSTATAPTVSSTEKTLFDLVDPISYRWIIELFAKNNLESQFVGAASKKNDSGTLKPTSSSLNIKEKYKQLKDCKTELGRIKNAAYILGYKKCAECVGEGNVFDPSKHSFRPFIASEVAQLGISALSSGNDKNK